VRFQVLTAASKKMAVFWVVEIALMMEAVSTSETSVNFYQTTRRNNPEDSHPRPSHCPLLSTVMIFINDINVNQIMML
jgi:hypothetical protein